MWRVVRTGIGAVLVVAVCLPVSFALTILLVPLWRWIETRFAVEAIGHSGPAEWCFYLVWALLVGLCFCVYWIVHKRSGSPSERKGALGS